MTAITIPSTESRFATPWATILKDQYDVRTETRCFDLCEVW